MIVGNGMLARSLQKHDEQSAILFCSGVSNSQEAAVSCFQREADLIEQNSGSTKIFIYFSSSFVRLAEYEKVPYYQHKKKMEAFVKEKNTNYLIFRLPQLVGCSPNTNTLTNFLFEKIRNGRPFKVFKGSRRNLLDVDHVASVIHKYLALGSELKTTIHVENPVSYQVVDIVHCLEAILKMKALYTLVENVHPDFEPVVTPQCVDLFSQCEIPLGETYLHSLLSKYYSSNRLPC